jgi:hypothetical protein
MLTLHDALLLGLLPFLVATIATALTWRRKSSIKPLPSTASRPTGWPIVLAITVAVFLAGISEFVPKGIPKEAMNWLVLLPLIALLAGMAAEFCPWWGGWVAILLVLVAGCAQTYLIALTLASNSTSKAIMLLLAAAPAVVYTLWRPLALKRPGPTLLVLWLMIAGTTVVVESAGTFIQFGQYTLALVAAVAGILLATLIVRRPAISNGSLAAFVLLWMALLIFGNLWADVPAWRTALLAASPLAAWAAELPRGWKPFWRGTLRLALVAIPLAIVGIPAARELARLLNSQTDVSGY